MIKNLPPDVLMMKLEQEIASAVESGIPNDKIVSHIKYYFSKLDYDIEKIDISLSNNTIFANNFYTALCFVGVNMDSDGVNRISDNVCEDRIACYVYRDGKLTITSKIDI